MSQRWAFELLCATHDKEAFCCGEAALDEYLKRYARQDQNRDLSRTFVAVEPGQRQVAGYYSLSSASIGPSSVPPEELKGLPKYDVPVVLLGRLAVDQRCQGLGLGEALLLDACHRTRRLSEEVGIRALVVHALHPRARGFYLRYGFLPHADNELHLYLPIAVIRKLVFQR